jgi:hypothetical protein
MFHGRRTLTFNILCCLVLNSEHLRISPQQRQFRKTYSFWNPEFKKILGISYQNCEPLARAVGPRLRGRAPSACLATCVPQCAEKLAGLVGKEARNVLWRIVLPQICGDDDGWLRGRVFLRTRKRMGWRSVFSIFSLNKVLW